MRTLACALVLLVAAAPARADRRTDAARDHYKKGITWYDLASWDRAIEEFKQAYELSSEPGLLFNLAQAERLKKDYAQAVHFYERYLELSPDAPNRADVEAQLARMRAALEEERAHPPPPAPIAIAPPPPPPFASTRRGQAVIAAATGGAALSTRAQYDATCDVSRCDGGIYSNGHALAVTADVMIAIGALAAAGTLIAALAHRAHGAGR